MKKLQVREPDPGHRDRPLGPLLCRLEPQEWEGGAVAKLKSSLAQGRS